MICWLIVCFDLLSGGGRGIRTPGPVTVNSFQDCRNRPLCHPSGCKIIALHFIYQKNYYAYQLPLRKIAVVKHLSAVNKYFWKYRYRLILGILFVVLSNYFKILTPQVSGYIIEKVTQAIRQQKGEPPVARAANYHATYDIAVQHLISYMEGKQQGMGNIVVECSVVLLVLAVFSGLFLFLTRQTIIVMSRHIEFDQKNEVFTHYQVLDTSFYKTHSTGDMMNRIAEDVGRVRMYTGPALMYFINLASTIGLCLFYMFKEDARLTLYVLAPLPILALTIYYVNTIIHRKSEKVQALLSDLTTDAQESYSGIRVIKSFVQEHSMFGFFQKKSEQYRSNAVALAKVEAIYFPSMTLLIGISTLITILVGCINGANSKVIVEFVMYINLLTFPVSAIGWTASMIQRAAASQKRLNEFLQTIPGIKDEAIAATAPKRITGDIVFNQVSFTYPHTGITAINYFDITICQGQKVMIIGRTGSGKTTLAQLLLRFYNPSSGSITIGGQNIEGFPLRQLREQVSYVAQDVFLFSDSVANNISFGLSAATDRQVVEQAARFASVHREIEGFEKGYDTMIGERGVTLSGGQKQRISIARALIKDPEIIVFDDCLSAVDAKTESEIVNNLYRYLDQKTAIIITHRIFSSFHFDNIIVLDEGGIAEQGTHEQLLHKDGYYAELYRLQLTETGGETQS